MAVRLGLVVPATALTTVGLLALDWLLPLDLANPQPQGLTGWVGAAAGYGTIFGGAAVPGCVAYALVVGRVERRLDLQRVERIVIAVVAFFLGATALTAMSLGGAPDLWFWAVAMGFLVSCTGALHGGLDDALARRRRRPLRE